MAGNQRRRGAVRKSNKKGPTVGSGGQRRRGLEGRGPTPKAEERVGHPAARRAARASRERGQQRRGARESGEVLYGRNTVVEALRALVPATALHVASRMDSDDRVKEALAAAVAQDVPVMEAPRQELDRLAGGGVHQGLVLQVPPYEYAHPDDLLDVELPGTPLLVALDGITDPHNLGAVVRSAAAFGGHGVVVPERRSAGMTATAWKTSAGAAARIPVARATNLTRALQGYRRAGFFVVGLDADGDVELPELALADQPLVVVVGSEGKGLSRLVRETCDQVVSIPMSGGTESLNASVAAGVTLYEVARSRR